MDPHYDDQPPLKLRARLWLQLAWAGETVALLGSFLLVVIGADATLGGAEGPVPVPGWVTAWPARTAAVVAVLVGGVASVWGHRRAGRLSRP